MLSIVVGEDLKRPRKLTGRASRDLSYPFAHHLSREDPQLPISGRLDEDRGARRIAARLELARGRTLVAIAVEQEGSRLARCRLHVIDDAPVASLRPFLLDHAQAGTTVITRRGSGARGMLFYRLRRRRRPQRAATRPAPARAASA